MPIKKGSGKKGGFSLAPITLSEPIKATDGFTNLVESPASGKEAPPQAEALGAQGSAADESGGGESESLNTVAGTVKSRTNKETAASRSRQLKSILTGNEASASSSAETAPPAGNKKYDLLEKKEEYVSSFSAASEPGQFSLSEAELLRILDADSPDEIYELTDVLRASSLKLYATLVRLADSRGRARVKNHELMSKSGIKGIATLYKQERWLMDLKLIEKKAKPGPHDGSSYVVHKLERLPLPAEIYDKFREYLSGFRQGN